MRNIPKPDPFGRDIFDPNRFIGFKDWSPPEQAVFNSISLALATEGEVWSIVGPRRTRHLTSNPKLSEEGVTILMGLRCGRDIRAEYSDIPLALNYIAKNHARCIETATINYIDRTINLRDILRRSGGDPSVYFRGVYNHFAGAVLSDLVGSYMFGRMTEVNKGNELTLRTTQLLSDLLPDEMAFARAIEELTRCAIDGTPMRAVIRRTMHMVGNQMRRQGHYTQNPGGRVQ